MGIKSDLRNYNLNDEQIKQLMRERKIVVDNDTYRLWRPNFYPQLTIYREDGTVEDYKIKERK